MLLWPFCVLLVNRASKKHAQILAKLERPAVSGALSDGFAFLCRIAAFEFCRQLVHFSTFDQSDAVGSSETLCIGCGCRVGCKT
jgi:hypothetical protein